jgi:hypothetical protein
MIWFACHSSEFYCILHIQDLIAYSPRGHAGLCVLRKCKKTKTKKKEKKISEEFRVRIKEHVCIFKKY